MDSNELYLRIKSILIDQFEVDAAAISMEANLYDELEIDSIDAVDFVGTAQGIDRQKDSARGVQGRQDDRRRAERTNGPVTRYSSGQPGND